MRVKVGTFNLNNLFSRYNFSAGITTSSISIIETTITLNLESEEDYRLRMFRGQLVDGKSIANRQHIADRILAMDLDVLAVQEVEDVDTLKRFNSEALNRLYPHIILIEGNDMRLIDVAIMSKLPIGGTRSWQTAVHPGNPNSLIFSRDLLEVDILNSTRNRRLFTVFNTHLKSKFNPTNDPDAEARSNLRRQCQAETVAQIVRDVTRPDSSYVILGDMNDSPDSAQLSPLVSDPELSLTNGLLNPVESRTFEAGIGTPQNARWTHRFRSSGVTTFELFDQIWLSPSLAAKQTGAFIDRRIRAGGDGSDHDPAWVELDV